MLEALIIIISLGGLEIALWWADHKGQAEQLATLEAIWVELALLNEERSPKHSAQMSETSSVQPVERPIAMRPASIVVTQ